MVVTEELQREVRTGLESGPSVLLGLSVGLSLEMATGSGRLPAGRSAVDVTVQLDVPWNAPAGGVCYYGLCRAS